MSAQQATSRGGQIVILVLAVVLAILHQDFWWWDDGALVFGFMPVGLAYHAGFSLAAAALWTLAILIAWPHDLERLAEESNEPKNPQ